MTTEAESRPYVCLLKVDDDYFLMGDPEQQCIRGWDTERDALDYWEATYRKAILQGGVKSSSAAIHFVFWRPSIVVAPTDEALPRLVLSGDPYTLSNDQGCELGLKCRRGPARKLWNAGAKPRIWREEWGVEADIQEAREAIERAKAVLAAHGAIP